MSPRRAKRLRVLLLVAVGAVAVGLAVVAYSTDLLRELELSTVDKRFNVRGDQGRPKNIVVVEVDTQTFTDLGLRWPFPRRVYARATDRLRRAGARTIAYDIQFTEASENPEDDIALAEAIARTPHVVLGTSEVTSRGHTHILGGDDVLREIGARPGDALLPPDPGGVLRRFPYEISGLKSLAVVSAETALGRRIPPSEPGGHTGWIDYRGGPGTIAHISFSKLVRGKFPPGYFRNKVVVIGASAPSLQDSHATPTTGSELMPGPEIQANAILTAMRGFPLKGTPTWLDVLLIALLGLLPPLASRRLGALRAGGLVLGAGIAYAVATQIAFNSGWILPVVYPLGALVLAEFGSVSVYAVTAALEKERTRDLFSRFVPEAVVAEVVDRTDDDLRLGGQRLEATVLFADLRGFTTFAENVTAETVIDVLNHYLESMSDAILDHLGTLVAYMGDGIMAVFGAPIEQPDHADRALGAAREMISERLPEFNAWMQEAHGSAGFRMGIGLNSGPVSSGNVGSDRRCEYTAVGDTTNSAARIEQMTKDGDHMLLFADSTRELLREPPPDMVFAGERDIRGRRGTVKLWTVANGQPSTASTSAAARSPEDTAPSI